MTLPAMNTLQSIHLWVGGTCFAAAILGLITMMTSFAFPVRSRASAILFGSGISATIVAVLTYVMWLGGTAIMVVVRS